MHTGFVGSADTELIDIDGDETPQPNRSEVRLNWTHKEDERLVRQLHFIFITLVW